MRVLTAILVGIGVIGIIIFMLLLAGLLLYSLTPSIKGHMSEIPVSYDKVQVFDQKLETFKEEIKAAAATEEVKIISLSVTEEEVNSKVIELLAEGKLPMKELAINFNEDLCWVYAELNNPGIAAKTGIIADIEAVEGEIKVTVLDFRLGRLLLPKSADDWLASSLDILVKMQSPLEDLPVQLIGIDIGDDDFTIEVQTESSE
jgi:hypothetical protein